MRHGNRGKRALLIALLCLPLVFIAYFAVRYASANLSSGSVSGVTVAYPDGKTAVYTAREDIDFYVNAFLDASDLKEPLREPSEEEAVRVSCDRGDRVLEYVLYPELSLTGCMFSKPDGGYAVFDAETAKAFLSRDEYQYLYAARFLPALQVRSGALMQHALPVSYEWTYQRMDGTTTPYQGTEHYDGSTVYELYSDRDNAVSFTVQPDAVTFVYTDAEGKVLEQSNAQAFLFATDTEIHVSVEAEWKENSSLPYAGKASYHFTMLYDIPATLTLSAQTAAAGDTLVVTAKNLNQAETITLSGSLTDVPLRFAPFDDVKMAVLAIPADCPVGDQTLAIACGDNTTEFSVKVTEPDKDLIRLSLSSSVCDTLLNESAQKQLTALLAYSAQLSGDVCYGDPLAAFASPADASPAYGFPSDVLINVDGSLENILTFNTIGQIFNVAAGTKVATARSGKVVYAGELTMLGNVIIIDHGCGVMSWYYGLTGLDRKEGAELYKGDSVGTAAANAFDQTSGFGFCVSVNGAFVRP